MHARKRRLLRARLRATENADPADPAWESEFSAATTAANLTGRRVVALEQLRAAQVERGGKRDAAVKAAAAERDGIASALATSRDQVAAAAAAHLTALARLAGAVGGHNAVLARSRARLAELGLRTRDDLVAEGEEHAEGVLDGHGVRAGGVDWTPVPAPGVVSHALRQVLDTAPGFRGPFAHTKYVWRAHEVERRPDGLEVPTLADAGAAVPEVPKAVHVQRATVQDESRARVAEVEFPQGHIVPAGESPSNKIRSGP